MSCVGTRIKNLQTSKGVVNPDAPFTNINWGCLQYRIRVVFLDSLFTNLKGFCALIFYFEKIRFQYLQIMYTQNTSLVAPATMHCFKIQNRGLKMADGVWKGFYAQIFGRSHQLLLNSRFFDPSTPSMKQDRVVNSSGSDMVNLHCTEGQHNISWNNFN